MNNRLDLYINKKYANYYKILQSISNMEGEHISTKIGEAIELYIKLNYPNMES